MIFAILAGAVRIITNELDFRAIDGDLPTYMNRSQTLSSGTARNVSGAFLDCRGFAVVAFVAVFG